MADKDQKRTSDEPRDANTEEDIVGAKADDDEFDDDADDADDDLEDDEEEVDEAE
jgi:hypothetical protein